MIKAEVDVSETVTSQEQNMFPNKQTERTNKGSTSSNGSTSSASNSPSSETQAKEKLALYVYEYLLHQGATRAAQTFLSEIQWEKNITLGDPPGFLHSWWCVFWDLYSAAPERQEPHNHSPEAKAFHDLNSGALPSPSYIPQPPGDMSSMGGMPPSGYYSHSRPPSLSNSQTSPHQLPPQGMMHGAFMNNRYNTGRPTNIRIPNQSIGPGGQSPFSTMDPSRQQQAGPYQTSSLMNAAAMRGFNNGMPPGVPPSYNRIQPLANGCIIPMGPRGPWNNPPTPSSLTPGPPRTPILSSPPDPTTPFGLEPPDSQIPLSEGPESLEDIPTDSTESVAIQRIKESMKEEVKKYESENNHVQEYYNMH